jgi:NTP-dependent ternary system trypsin peptidase co-occuring protein
MVASTFAWGVSMAHFVKYQLEDGTVVEIESAEAPPAVHAGDVMRGGGIPGPAQDAPRQFNEALGPVKAAAHAVMDQFRELAADEIEVEFGLTTSGEMGNFAIGTVGVGANYKVKMKWKKSAED